MCVCPARRQKRVRSRKHADQAQSSSRDTGLHLRIDSGRELLQELQTMRMDQRPRHRRELGEQRLLGALA